MRSRPIICSTFALGAFTAQINAQTPPTTSPRDSTHAQTQAPFFTTKDALLAGGFAAGTIIMFPLDRSIAEHIHQNPNSANWVNDASRGVEDIASPGSYLIGGGLYLVGLVGHYGRV